MKVDQNMVSISGDLVYAEEIKMEVAVGASGMVLKGLIEQYSNPTAAVLRELTSNAWDSHVEAGQTRPVEVSLPSTLSPHFIVEDFGVGMSREEMKQFGQFGESSKRDTNDLIGSWGMGSKSPLAISSEYTVVGIKDGLRNVCVVGRHEDGSPYMGFTNPEPMPTDLPNGVKITVPYSNARPFKEALARGMFGGWLPGTISIDGVVNTPEQSVHTNPKYTVVENFGWSLEKPRSDSVGAALVGPILFPIRWDSVYNTTELEPITPILNRTILNLPIGSVSIPSNRENLIYTPKTIAMIRQQVDGIIAIGSQLWQAKVSTTATMREAWSVVSEANKAGYKGPFNYKGTTLVLPTYPAPTRSTEGEYFTSSYVDPAFADGNPIERSYHPVWDMSSVKSTVLRTYAILITGCGAAQSRMVTRFGQSRAVHTASKSARAFMHGLILSEGFTFPQSPAGKYPLLQSVQIFYARQSLDELGSALVGMFNKTYTASEFNAYARAYRSKKAKEAHARLKLDGPQNVAEKTFYVRELKVSFYGQSTWESEVLASEMDKSGTYVLLQNESSDWAEDTFKSALMTKKGYHKSADFLNVWKEVQAAFPKLHILYLYKNENRDNYEKAFPNVLSVTELYEKATERSFSAITADQIREEVLRSISGNNYWVSRSRDAVFDDIDSPDTQKLLRAIKKATSETREVFDTLRQLQHCLRMLRSPKADDYQQKLTTMLPDTAMLPDNPLRKYPLLEHASYAHTPHIIEYINLIDARDAALESA